MTDDPGVFAPPHRAITAGILLSMSAVAIEGMAVATILPSVAFELGGLEAYGWAFSAFMLMSLLGAISAGQIADRRPVGIPARIGFTVFSLGLAIASLAPSWPILLVARGVQGFGAGYLMSVSYVAVARAYPESLRPRVLALLASAWVIPSLVGPAIAGQIAEHLSWRLVFIGIVPAVGIAAWMLLPALSRLPAPASDAAPAVRGQLVPALRLTFGVGLFLLAVSVPLQVALAAGLAVVGLILAVPALKTLLPQGTFSGKAGGPAAVAVRGLLVFGFFGAEALIPLGLTTQRGLPASLVGLSLTAGALAWVTGSWFQEHTEASSRGSLSQRSLRTAGGMVLVAVGVLGVATTILSPGLPVELVVLMWAVSGLGMGVAYPASTLTALGTAPEGQEGSAASALQVAETLGVALGTGAVGALFALSVHLNHAMADGLTWGFVVTICALALGLPMALRMSPDLVPAGSGSAAQP